MEGEAEGREVGEAEGRDVDEGDGVGTKEGATRREAEAREGWFGEDEVDGETRGEATASWSWTLSNMLCREREGVDISPEVSQSSCLLPRPLIDINDVDGVVGEAGKGGRSVAGMDAAAEVEPATGTASTGVEAAKPGEGCAGASGAEGWFGADKRGEQLPSNSRSWRAREPRERRALWGDSPGNRLRNRDAKKLSWSKSDWTDSRSWSMDASITQAPLAPSSCVDDMVL